MRGRCAGLGVVAGLVVGGTVVGGGVGCKARQVVKQSSDLTRLRAEANEAYAAGEFDRALGAYSAYVEQRPHSAWGRHWLGRTYLQLGEGRQAREHLAVAHDLEPENMEYAESLADALVQLGEPKDLFEFLERLATTDQSSAGQLRVARYAERMGFMDEALIAYRKGVAIDGSTSPEAHRAMADFYRRIGERSGEVTSLRKVLWFDAQDRAATERLEELGEIVGPSFAVHPGADG